MFKLNALKKLFSRKQKDFAPPQEPPAAQAPTEQLEEAPTKQSEETQMEKQKDSSRKDNRPQIICKNCGAPNDTFVNICWLCKKSL